MGIYESIKEIINYLEESEKNHYEEHIVNGDNKNDHIYNHVTILKDWIDSPMCPLIDKDEVELKFARKCEHCGKVFNEGFCIGRGEEYYCSKECLNTKYTPEEWDEMYKFGDSYWTTWEDEEDMQYYEDGTEIDEE